MTRSRRARNDAEARSTRASPSSFRVERVLGRSCALWARHLPLLFVLALGVHLPRLAGIRFVWGRLVLSTGETWSDAPVLALLLSFDYGAFFTTFSQVFVTLLVAAWLEGRPATLGATIRGGLHRVPRVLCVSLILLALDFVLRWILVRQWIDVVPRIVVPPLLLSPFWVAASASVAEGSRGALRRSWTLTRGHRLAVGALLLVPCLLDVGPRWLLGPDTAGLPRVAVYAIRWTHDLLVVSLEAVLAAVTYHALRREKDGTDLPELRQIFG